MEKDVPRITYYAKVIDNLTNTDITSYKNAMDNALWYYGKIDSSLGGESQFVVEFDIWNNEPSFNHRTFDAHCSDANNVKLNVEFNSNRKNDEEFASNLYNTDFFYARSLTSGFDDFIPVNNKKQLDISGNLNPNKNMLSGEGDHCIVQTKIKLDNNTLIENGRYNFNLVLSYDFE